MIEKYCDSQIPAAADKGGSEASIAVVAGSAISSVLQSYDQYSFARALEGIWEIIAQTDKYITQQKPWELAEKPEKKAELANVLATAAAAIRVAAVLAHPVIPASTQRIRGQERE